MVVRPLRCLARDERGTGLVEMALLAPVLALFTVGIVDLGMGLTRRMELHQAVHRTLEKVAAREFVIETKDDGSLDTAYIKEDAAAGAGVEEDEVTVRAWLECDGEEQDNFNDTCAPPAGAPAACSSTTPPASANCQAIVARYVEVRIDSSYRPTFGRVVPVLEDGTFPLFAEAAVRLQ